jgi:protein CpxP
MSRGFTRAMAGAVFALCAGAAPAALAQPAPQPGAQTEAHERGMMGRRGMDPAKMADHVRAILQLRPAQEPALQAYLAALRPSGDEMQPRGGPGMERMTTPERLTMMEQRMARRQAAMRSRTEATRKFYAQLDAGQKRAFDELFGMMMGHMGGRGGKGMMRHHMDDGMRMGPGAR